ncbi:MAG: endonuclease III [Verrucomicrobia bacterium]|jgi:endonuclease III|nr:endonuclease III [Verrucomicrobiota bacterium]
MPRESQSSRAARVRTILDLLNRVYPDAYCELDHTDPLELLIATILSAQCTDKQVNIVTRDLFPKYRTAADYANADPAELENDLRRIGLFRSKARNIRACCAKLVALHGGRVPGSMEALIALDGVGRKTANVVLGNAFGLCEGIVVDTHVARLSQRLGFTRETTPEKIERALMRLVPRDQWTILSHWLIWHGRRRCSARKPDCANCELKTHCPAADR